MKFIFQITSVIYFAIQLVSCTEEPSDKYEREKFTRIYDTDQFNESFRPVDILETPDKGYIIIGEKTIQNDELSRRIYLLKTDQAGNFVKDYLLDEEYINPVRGITPIGESYYFFCMDQAGNGQIVNTDVMLETLDILPVNVSYPAAINYAGSEEFLVLGYDQVEKKTSFSKVRTDGSVTLTRRFKIADDDSYEDIIMKHFLKTGQQYPFSVGRFPGGSYYFNGFYDYNFSMILTSLDDDDDVDQYIYGQRDDGGLSAITPLSVNTFASAYFNFGANYFVPDVSLSSDPNSITNLGGYNMQELVPDARVVIKEVQIKQKPYLLYITDTKSKQIGLYVYEKGSNTLAGIKYLGFSNPFEAGNFIVTSDGGLAICSSTFIAGRFSRISLIKLSREELETAIQ